MALTHRSIARVVLLAGLSALTPQPAQAQFNPPRVMLVLNKHNPGDLPEAVASKRSCYIDMGREASIHRGDELNVYREVYPMGSQGPAVRVQVGTMRIDAIGYGEEHPIAENDTAENKALNRRIEIVVWD